MTRMFLALLLIAGQAQAAAGAPAWQAAADETMFASVVAVWGGVKDPPSGYNGWQSDDSMPLPLSAR